MLVNELVVLCFGVAGQILGAVLGLECYVFGLSLEGLVLVNITGSHGDDFGRCPWQQQCSVVSVVPVPFTL